MSCSLKTQFLFLSITFLLTLFSTLITLTKTQSQQQDEKDNVSESLKVVHYDCKRMRKNRMYSLNQVAPCTISPEQVKVADAYVHVYQRSFRTSVDATMCRVKIQPLRFHCGMFSHSSIVHKQSSITTDYVLSADDCRQAIATKELNISYWGKTFTASVDYDVETQSWGNAGTKRENKDECDDSGEVKHLSIVTFMQNVTLYVDFQTLEVRNPFSMKLPCTLNEEGCFTTTLDPHAYVWDAPENCLVTQLFSQPARMLKHTPKFQSPIYFLVSDSTEHNDSSNPIKFDIRIRVFNEKKQVCGKPEKLYRTNFANLFVAYDNGFNLDSGHPRKPSSFSSNSYRLSIDSQQNLEYSSLNYRWHPNGTRYGETPWQQFGADKIDYELHLQAKLNFLVFYNAKRLRHSELTLLRSDCELERTQFLIIFMLALQNTRLAGYMLTGDRSMFLDTDGSVAWLYQCPKVISPLKILDRCYDRIPIEYEGKLTLLTQLHVKPSPSQTKSHVKEHTGICSN